MNKLSWILGVLVILAVFILCFLAIDFVGSPEEDKGPEVVMEVIATSETNAPLIDVARRQGWIAADANEMTSIDASKVTDLGTAFQRSKVEHLDELRYFVGLQEIHAGAFAHSDALRTIVIPQYVTVIDDGALADCPSLTSISVDSANTHYDSRGECNAVVHTWKGSLMIVAGCSTTIISDDVRYIAPMAFSGCRNLKSITLPEKMTEIGGQAFRNCSSLTEFVIPQGVRFVEDGTFMGCTALQTVTIPKSVERLRKDSFCGCRALTTINCIKKFPPVIENAFDSYNATVNVPKGMKSKYQADRYWKSFTSFKEVSGDI